MDSHAVPRKGIWIGVGVACAMVLAIGMTIVVARGRTKPSVEPSAEPREPRIELTERLDIDTSGLTSLVAAAPAWNPTDSLNVVAKSFEGLSERRIETIDRRIATSDEQGRVYSFMEKATCYLAAGKPERAHTVLEDARAGLQHRAAERQFLASLMYFQGVAALRLGENENCIMCRGESSCILPIVPAAIHQNEKGSRLAIRHFSEYLEHFPDDLEAKWLLNVAHMTLGEHPLKVDPRFLIRLDRIENAESSIGKFRDIGHLVGVNRFNQAGGAIMDDFDNDGLLDIVVSSFDPTQSLGFYRNAGNGQFVERGADAGILDQLGGMNCVQVDYNNDGLLDIYIPRGAWLHRPIRPSLLRNDGGARFTDVTEQAGLLDPVNSISAMWADYDNDGWVDLFVCCEKQRNRLYRNLGNGAFQEVAARAGVAGSDKMTAKGCAWLDYDNDDYPDLFLTDNSGPAQLYHNDRNGTFSNSTKDLGIDGPNYGFSCWAFDYNNDGWLDIFATSYDRSLKDIVKGLIGEPHERHSNRLFLNLEGRGFRDVTREAGLDMVFATMGSNYGDFDNDGYLDIYLGTGEPCFSTLVPNRMFRNRAGERFVEITGSAGVGHLQKGHGVACGDWDRDGNVDIFIEMGGAIDGDKYHNVLFQNPGHEHSWITIKLIGEKTNRAGLGARIKIVTAADTPQVVHRHISPGSSFGGSPLQQTIGLASAKRIETLEIHWPTSGTTQTFRDIAVNQALEITEFAKTYRVLDWPSIPVPK